MTTYISYVYEPCMLISQIKERGTGAPSDSLFAIVFKTEPLLALYTGDKHFCGYQQPF